MPRYITLNLVNEQGTPHPWPGTPTPFELGSELSATPVWIGVSADGSDNQIFPITADAVTILNSWPHLYQGVQLNIAAVGDDSPQEVGVGEFVYYNSLEEFQRLVAACCIAEVVEESPQESPAESPEEPPFDMMMRVNFGDPGQEFAFELNLFTPAQFYVDWGDGSAEEPFFGDSNIPSHVYADAGEYTVRLRFEPPAPAVVDSVVVSNMPLTYFALNPAWGNGLAMNVLQLDSGQLTDADIDFAAWEFTAVNTLILANNQFSNAVLGLLPAGFTTLNLSGNNLGTVDMDNLVPGAQGTLGSIFMNNCQLTSVDFGSLTNNWISLQFQNNLLEGFDTGVDVFALGELRLNGNSLPQVDIDALLQALDAQGNENGIVDLSDQTPNMPPSLAGAVAVGSLESKFWTVTVDS